MLVPLTELVEAAPTNREGSRDQKKSSTPRL